MNSGEPRTHLPRAGFSVLELLIVVGILAALVGLAIPYYQDYLGQSRRAVMEANFRGLYKAVVEFHADKGYYPADADALTILTTSPHRYMVEIPVDPESATVADPVPATWGYYLDGTTGLPRWGSKYEKLIGQ